MDTNNVDLEYIDENWNNFLHNSIEEKFLYSIIIFLEKGLDPNVPNSVGLYPLHLAIRTEKEIYIQILLKYGAKTDIYTTDWLNLEEFIEKVYSEDKIVQNRIKKYIFKNNNNVLNFNKI